MGMSALLNQRPMRILKHSRQADKTITYKEGGTKNEEKNN